LVAVLPAAILVHEVASSGEGNRVRHGARAAVARHAVLVRLYVAGAVVAAIVAIFGSLGNLLGTYAVTAQGSPLPSTVWRAIATPFDPLALGSGLVPVVLGGGWLIAAVGRPRDRASHAFATLALLATASLLVEASSYDVRFGGPREVHDRYLFYVVPLLLVG